MRLFSHAAVVFSLVLCGFFAFSSNLMAADEKRALALRVVDRGTDRPLANVKVTYFPHPKSDGQLQTDEAGRVSIPLPDSEQRWLRVTADAAAYVPMQVSWYTDRDQTFNVPEQYTLGLERGTTFGGVVVDDAGAPVEGATVNLNVVQSPDPARKNERVQIGSEHANKTDAQGRWTFNRAPQRVDRVVLHVFHPRYANTNGIYPTDELTDVAPLRDQSYRATLVRGRMIHGIVQGPNGQPIAGAAVRLTNDPFGGDRWPAVETDAAGRFELGCLGGATAGLIVKAKGMAPDLQRFTMPADADHEVTFRLEPARALGGRVLDPDGKPVAKAAVYLTRWRGQHAFEELRFSTDGDGRFQWDEAPGDAVLAGASAQGFAPARDVALVAGRPNEIRLGRLLVVRGTVVDDATNEPIRKFDILTGINKVHGTPAYWQRRYRPERPIAAPGADGTFEERLDVPQFGMVVRVEADGYLPADSKAFTVADGNQDLTFRLRRGAGITGTVTNAAGQPVAGATVAIVGDGFVLSMNNGQIPEHLAHQVRMVKTPADGTFSLPPTARPYVIVAVGDDGFASIEAEPDARGGVTLALQPWGTVEGVAMIGDKPAAGHKINATHASGFTSPLPPIQASYQTTADAEGRFRLDRVVPGEITIGRYLALDGGAYQTTHVQRMDIEPGATANVRIGGGGRTVAGLVQLPKELAGRPDLSFLFVSLKSNVDLSELGLPKDVKAMTPAQKKTWLKSPAGLAYAATRKAALAKYRTYHLNIAPDGTWRVEDLPAGDYSMYGHVVSTRANDRGMRDTLATIRTSLTVPDLPEGAPIEPLKVSVEMPNAPRKMTEKIRVGDAAPALVAPTLDGKQFSLADRKGKYVLVDFWATWCGPCRAQTPHLKAAYDAFGADERFEIVGLSLDAKEEQPRQYAQKEGLAWTQAFLGEWPKAIAPKDWGVESIPSIWLIGPDGKVIAKNLQGPAIRAAVEAALKK